MSFWEDVNVRMRRAVQQEGDAMTKTTTMTTTTAASHSLPKARTTTTFRRSSGGRRGVVVWVILLSPVLIVLVMIYLRQVYNVLLQQEEQAHHDMEAAASMVGGVSERMENDRDDLRREQQSLRKRQADMARLKARTIDKQQSQEEDGAPPPDEEDAGDDEAHQADNNNNNNNNKLHKPPPPAESRKVLVLTTSHGPIRVQMRPDLSKGSVHYLEQLVESQVCTQCHFYRAEMPGILQGIFQNKDIPLNDVRGPCPNNVMSVKNDCPDWDPDCGCHGPLMSRGAVAWAAGMAGGPDFFIDAYPRTARWWGTQHTNFGFIEDSASMAIVDEILRQPVYDEDGMLFLKKNEPFELSFE